MPPLIGLVCHDSPPTYQSIHHDSKHNREIQALVEKGIIQPYNASRLKKPDLQEGVARRLIIGAGAD